MSCPAGPDSDLCAECYAAYGRGEVVHPLSHIRGPREHEFVATAGTSAARYAGWLDVVMPRRAAPQVPRGSLVRPEFCFGQQSSFGAYGCVVKTNAGTLILTALHVLDEVGKGSGIDTTLQNTAYSGAELPRVIDKVNLYDVLADQWIFAPLGSAARMLELPHARSNVEEPLGYRDLSAFAVSADATLTPLPLAAYAPEVGEPVWLTGKFDQARNTWPAVVVGKTELSYVFRFATPTVGPRYTSGAAILNERGEVVGVNVGSGRFAGQQFGHAIHAENIQAHLRGDCPGMGPMQQGAVKHG